MSEDRKKSPTEQYFAERAKERAKEADAAATASSASPAASVDVVAPAAPVADRCPLCGHASAPPLADGTVLVEAPPIVRQLRPDEVARPAKLAADAERAKRLADVEVPADPADPAKA